MDYTALANELLGVRVNLLQVPASQQLSQMVKGEMFVLNYLVTHETIIHPKELSEKMAVTTARIASLLNHMEEKKLICRYPDPDDSRQIVVVLTQQGKRKSGRSAPGSFPLYPPCWRSWDRRTRKHISASRKRFG